MAHSVALALQGGGAHGAFTWGVLDRLLDEVAQDRLTISALSGASAGAINAALCAAGLASAPRQADAAARTKTLLGQFWGALSERAFFSGNPLLGGLLPGFLTGWNIDWNPAVIALDMAALVLSPYDQPFYSNPLRPLIDDFLPAPALEAINRNGDLPLYVCATNVGSGQRRTFTQPQISAAVLLASACLPSLFQAITIDNQSYWDGGFMGNPALAPLVKRSGDIVVVTVNPLKVGNTPPRRERAILDRLHDISWNAPLVLELNAVHAINKLLARLPPGPGEQTGYRPIRMHLIRNDQLLEPLGSSGKLNASPAFLAWLFDGGRATAARWLEQHYADLGQRSSCDWKDDFDLEHDVIDPALKGG
jgi:NTE family protein